MTNEEKQIDIITELLIDFDEMGFAPTTTVPNPEAYAIEWRNKITEELKCYRKASDVVREIFAEIEKMLKNQEVVTENQRCKEVGEWLLQKYLPKKLAELKKKYESEDTE